MTFQEFFAAAMDGGRPYPYQTRMAEAAWPDLLEIPTGLGKTAAVTLAWAWKRGLRPGGERADVDPGTPRRLVWCLPMRTLVEQTAENARAWLSRLGWLAAEGNNDGIAVHLLMGGEDDLKSWADRPEDEQILIGTQDMLLSRALMRGYGMSRYQWPVHYALLHNDALWVFDEVQLMGPALPTSTQLEAFRRMLGITAPAHSLWISATLDASWLDSVDFRPHCQAGLARQALGDADRAEESAQRRLHASKTLARAETVLNADTAGDRAKAYVNSLAEEIRSAHVPGEQTLVIVNRVERAQSLYRALSRGADAPDCLLLHARFRPRERRTIEQRLREPVDAAGRIVVATQAVEAGVDIDSRVLFTELAPWSSLVQRFGRCNRAGRFDAAAVRWIDIDETGKELALPYPAESLTAARETLSGLASASPAVLPLVTERPPAGQVLRRRDLLELFNTDPDLSGFDVDVSPYIRDTGTPQAQVFWRRFDSSPGPDEPGPARDELCPVSITQLKAHLKKGREAWRMDALARATDTKRWERLAGEGGVRPGQVYMLAADQGGYLVTEGFVAGDKTPVEPVPEMGAAESYDSDRLTAIGRWVGLPDHLGHVARAAEDLAQALDMAPPESDLLATAARWHDVGKAHEAFVRGIGARPDDPDGPWAKSEGSGRPDYHVLDEQGEKVGRPYFRHELASMLAWLEHGGESLPEAQRDLIAYLIVAHHGRVRLGLRALPGEQEPPEPGRLFARGVWAGDRLAPLVFEGVTLPETILQLDLMQLGDGPQGPSWTARTRRLLETHGPFRLAWLEALVRIADWRASARERMSGTEESV